MIREIPADERSPFDGYAVNPSLQEHALQTPLKTRQSSGHHPHHCDSAK
jgi:hypothetical protein